MYIKSAAYLLFGIVLFWACEKSAIKEPEGFKLVKYAPVDVSKTNTMHIYIHYMPWFEDKSSSGDGNWGMHWTMSTQNPDIIDSEGKRNIASHYYPLTGPYATSDPALIEYQLLLMKYAGIEGILFDWYGSTDANDYKSIRDNTEKIIQKLSETGLKFAIVYEDRTTAEIVNQNLEADKVTAAQNDLIYLEDHYFNNPAYIKIDGKPLFMVFGPEEIHTSTEWSDIFSSIATKPVFLVLNWKSTETAPASSGEYIWVDNSSIDLKYSSRNNFEYFMGGAYPGFKDFYYEGGWGTGFDWQIDHNNGQTFIDNLQKAKSYNVDYLQLITWNDYGEGTMIEPTKEFGFTMLESLQSFTGVEYTQTELEKIFQLYELRQLETKTVDFNTQLDQCFYYLVSLQTQQALHLIDSLRLN